LQQVRIVLARHLRALVNRVGVLDELDDVVKQFAGEGWPDGWIAVRRTIRLDVEHMPAEIARRLHRMEAELHPHDLTQRVHAYVLSRTHSYMDMVESEEGEGEGSADFKRGREKVGQAIEQLGREVSAAPDVLIQLLPDLLRSTSGQLWHFGRGLALGASSPITLWQLFRSELAALSANERNVLLMQGFIAAAMSRDVGIANQLLDEAVTDSVLG